MAGTSGVALELFHNVDDVLNGTHRFEGFRLNFMPRLLQVNHHIYGINAVEIRVFVKPGLRRNELRVEFKSLIRSAETS